MVWASCQLAFDKLWVVADGRIDLGADGLHNVASQHFDHRRRILPAFSLMPLSFMSDACIPRTLDSKCWCGKEPRLWDNGGEVASAECAMPCAGCRKEEKCGDHLKMSVYKMLHGKSFDDRHPCMGCFADRKAVRAMPFGKHVSKNMTIEVRSSLNL